MSALVEARDLVKRYPVRRGALRRRMGEVRALDGVSLAVGRGECVALVGESGCGKTTLGRCLLRLTEPSTGRVLFDGEDLLALPPAALRRRRRHFQMIFQDPSGSLDPRLRIGAALAQPIAALPETRRAARGERVLELLELVGLEPGIARRYPHELSGGQRQRVAIARALAPEPAFVVADEPVSSLDSSIRAQILNLLGELQRRLDLALVLIAHDLALVEATAGRGAVLYLGRLVEEAPIPELFARPAHPYTVSLLAAVPRPDPRRGERRQLLAGEPPSPWRRPSGCHFHPRCPIARPRCAEESPDLAAIAPGHRVACHYPGELEPLHQRPGEVELSATSNVGQRDGPPAGGAVDHHSKTTR